MKKMKLSTKILFISLVVLIILLGVFVWPGKLINKIAQKFSKKQQQSATALLDDASSKMGNDKYSEAKPILEKLVKEYPDNFTTWINLGICYLSSKELSSAAASFTKATQIDPKSPSAHLLLGNTQRDLGNNEAAIENYKKTLELNKKEMNAYINLASLYFSQKKYDEAISLLRQAKLELPNVLQIRYMLASYYKNLGQTANYKVEVSEILAINPNDKWAKSNR